MKKNLLTSLKELLEALGGNKSNKTNIVEVVDEITEQVKNNENDENGGTLYVHSTGELYTDPETNEEYEILDKSYADIEEAVNNNKNVSLRLGTLILPLTSIRTHFNDNDPYYIYFMAQESYGIPFTFTCWAQNKTDQLIIRYNNFDYLCMCYYCLANITVVTCEATSPNSLYLSIFNQDLALINVGAYYCNLTREQDAESDDIRWVFDGWNTEEDVSTLENLLAQKLLTEIPGYISHRDNANTDGGGSTLADNLLSTINEITFVL